MTPDEMIEWLLNPIGGMNEGVIANELLSAFWQDYPIENLRRLFVPATIGVAAFLVSELTEKARPFLKEIAELLNNEKPRVRGDAISAISLCTTWEDGWAIALIVKAIGDPHEGVRWIACNALRYMERSQIMAGLKYLHENEPNTIFGTLRYIFSTLEHRSETASATLEEMLTHEDQIARRFGAAMAVRPHLFIDPAFVAITAVTADPEVKEIVRHAIKMPLPPGTIWEGNNPFEG